MIFPKMSAGSCLARGLCGFCVLSVAALLIVTGSTVQAVELDVQKKIDLQEEACLKRDSSTAGCVACAEQAYKEWDRQLNIYYKKLIEQLEPAQKAELKRSQLNWIKFRDGEFKQIASLFTTLEGTMYAPMEVESRVRIVRDRTLQLVSYYRLFAEDEQPAPLPKTQRKPLPKPRAHP
jgi:uncharacterized protein YecT (DUF1311 family)